MGQVVRALIKWGIPIVLFFLIFNGIGYYFLSTKAQTEIETSPEETINFKDVSITVVNNGEYDNQLMKDIREKVEYSTKSILELTDSYLSPVHHVTLKLEPYTEGDYYRPPYISNTIYNPDGLLIETWNIEEQLLYNLFLKRAKTSPFTTIGLGFYLYSAENSKEVMDAHDYWLIHEKHHADVNIPSLLVNDEFTEDVVSQDYGPLPQARYYGVASFSKYLIDTYGIDHYVSLYDSPNVEGSMNEVYGSSLEELLLEWDDYITKKRSYLSSYQLDFYQSEYQFLYEE
ncbi:hypothetical protein [Litchfieldia salsa]|uniref:Uncharacterized protein n=1 Tax=Litchfieldia salsa TaxID=930152 RepID=A0A1H0U0W9_9BACI|nr:hypothetical protein [Litchfieldia salsa]SDP59675.1 hypothetical protein SAMN05216565_10463 [Litchfieldia salsa]